MVDEASTTITTDIGDLGGIIRIPETSRPLPGIVLVGGSGDGSRNDWGEWPDWIGGTSAVVLRHDKPGCGGAPGHWTSQSLYDRAQETMAALRVLRQHPSTQGQPVGLYGISQGGWVNLIAAALAGHEVDFAICHSGPFVKPAVLERKRIQYTLKASGFDSETISEALRWVDERTLRLVGAETPASILHDQNQYRGRPWFAHAVHGDYHNETMLAFSSKLLSFDPANCLHAVTCPVLALFGGDDEEIPVADSVQAFASQLPSDKQHGLAIFPNADHLLFQTEPSRVGQLAPGLLPAINGFLAAL